MAGKKRPPSGDPLETSIPGRDPKKKVPDYLGIVTADPQKYPNIPEHYQTDFNIAWSAINADPDQYRHAPRSIRGDPFFAKMAIELDEANYAYAPAKIQSNPEIAIIAVKDPENFPLVPRSLREDVAFVGEAIRANADLYTSLSFALQSNLKIARIAVEGNAELISFVPKVLQSRLRLETKLNDHNLKFHATDTAYYIITKFPRPYPLVHFKIMDVTAVPGGLHGTVLHIFDFFHSIARFGGHEFLKLLRRRFSSVQRNIANWVMAWIFDYAALNDVHYVTLYSVWSGFSKTCHAAINDADLTQKTDRGEPTKGAKHLVNEMFAAPQFKYFRSVDGSPVDDTEATARIMELKALVLKHGFYGKYGFIKANKNLWPKLNSVYKYTHYADLRNRHPLILNAPFVDLAVNVL